MLRLLQEKQDGQKQPQNTVSLLTAAVRAEGRDSQPPFTFTVVSPAQKNYLLQAESEQEMREWMAAIQVTCAVVVVPRMAPWSVAGMSVMCLCCCLLQVPHQGCLRHLSPPWPLAAIFLLTDPDRLYMVKCSAARSLLLSAASSVDGACLMSWAVPDTRSEAGKLIFILSGCPRASRHVIDGQEPSG